MGVQKSSHSAAGGDSEKNVSISLWLMGAEHRQAANYYFAVLDSPLI